MYATTTICKSQNYGAKSNADVFYATWWETGVKEKRGSYSLAPSRLYRTHINSLVGL